MSVSENWRYILDSEHDVHPCPDLMEWAIWMEASDRTVAQDRVGDQRVSTVFLGIDHGMLWRDHAPVLFETMVFGGHEDGFQRRYGTWAEAEAGHRQVVARLRESWL